MVYLNITKYLRNEEWYEYTQKHKKFKAKMIFQIIMVIIGGIIAAYGLETVLIPNSVSDGG